ncbi:MAG: ABC transporter substrate-binding protein [Acidaminococcales bacterium]|jgi:branched-chain amino acid transport system substrate-binding protein|nr:ABC transporter substrate-binding protein [Acidaminococcales bacterium]
MKNRKSLPALMAGLLLSAALLGGCGTDKKADDAVKIGLAIPLTGSSAQDGETIKNGVQLAIDEVNGQGGIKGKKVLLDVQDDKSDPKEAAIVANKLAGDKSVLAVVGHFNSSATLAGAPIYNKAGLVEISPGSSSPAVTKAGDYTFRVITTDAFQADYVAKWAVKDLGYKKIAVIYENNDYGKGLADVFDEKAKGQGAAIVSSDSYLAGETKDFSAILTKIKAAGPDMLFIGGLYNETALIAKQAKNIGLNAPIMGVDAIYSNALIDLGGKSVEGVLLPGFFHEGTDNPVAQKFIKAYKAKYKQDPATYAAYGYDAAKIVLDAIANAGTDRKAIRDYIAKVKGFQGATGINTFDENGDVMKDPLRLVIKESKFQVVK